MLGQVIQRFLMGAALVMVVLSVWEARFSRVIFCVTKLPRFELKSVFVIPGAVVGKNSMVAAGAVVQTGTAIPDGQVGNRQYYA